jgi:Fe-S-cluster containining protein
MKPFPCIRCGLCCQRIDKIPQLENYHKGDGVCIFLHNDLCVIYDIRPDICNIEKSYLLWFEEKISEDEFIIENLKACLELAKKANIQDIIYSLERMIENK